MIKINESNEIAVSVYNSPYRKISIRMSDGSGGNFNLNVDYDGININDIIRDLRDKIDNKELKDKIIEDVYNLSDELEMTLKKQMEKLAPSIYNALTAAVMKEVTRTRQKIDEIYKSMRLNNDKVE